MAGRPIRALAALLLLAHTACGAKPESGSASAAEARPQGSGGGKASGAGGARRPGGSGLALAPDDVALVRKGSIEQSVPVTGTLAPVEAVDVRARLEGDIEDVVVREGERVRAGQVLARFEASQQRSARESAAAAVAAGQSAVSTAQWTVDQSRELLQAGAIPERDLRAGEQSLAAARAQLAAAQSSLRSATSSLADTRVTSPINGTVSTRSVEGGEHVARGAPLLTVVRTEQLELSAAVPARRADEVRVGQRVRFEADARQFEGRVARISPTVDPSSRSVTVYVRVENASGVLRGGAFANGRIVGRSVADALIAPLDAVRYDRDGRPFVYRIENSVIQVANVHLGIVDEAMGVAQLTDGAREGDRVIVGNVGTLGRGMPVQLVGTDTAPGAGKP